MSSPLHAIQQTRLKRFSVEESVDVHCHILPGVDDGPANLDETLTLCRALMRDGITTVIATPHQLGRFEGRNLPAQVRAAVAELQPILDAKKIPIRVIPGGEVRIDQRIAKFLADDRIMTLADTQKLLLLELPTGVPIDPAMLMPRLEGMSARIVLAHAERYDSLQRDPEAAKAWLDCGAVLQVNAGSVIGGFGNAAANAVWTWLSRGWVSLIGTDAHSVGTRRPRISDAIEAIAKKLGEPVAKCVCIDNPLRVARGEDLLQAPMVQIT